MSELYVVATPIGNLRDITLRALDILKSVNTILCEDTRITSRLLQKYEIYDKKLLIYNDLSSSKDRLKILNILQTEDVALVSDAGTPLISDPGQKLIKLLKENSIKVTPIAGCSSVTAALSVSGLALDKFLFLGFLPASSAKRVAQLKDLDQQISFIFFERSTRLLGVLEEILKHMGDRKVTIAREITKIHEQVITDDISNIIGYFEANSDKLRGEFVVIVEKTLEKLISEDEIAAKIEEMLKNGYSSKDISGELSEIYGLNRKKIYEIALALKK